MWVSTCTFGPGLHNRIGPLHPHESRKTMAQCLTVVMVEIHVCSQSEDPLKVVS